MDNTIMEFFQIFGILLGTFMGTFTASQLQTQRSLKIFGVSDFVELYSLIIFLKKIFNFINK